MSHNESTIRETLRDFITTDLIRDKKYPLGDDEEVIAKGLMDSFALAEFGVFAEDQFNVYIPDVELTVSNMGTLNKMVQRVLKGLA